MDLSAEKIQRPLLNDMYSPRYSMFEENYKQFRCRLLLKYWPGGMLISLAIY